MVVIAQFVVEVDVRAAQRIEARSEAFRATGSSQDYTHRTSRKHARAETTISTRSASATRVTNKNVPYELGFWLRDHDYNFANPVTREVEEQQLAGGSRLFTAFRERNQAE